MKLYILFLLIPIVIFAQDNAYLDMKAKANSDGTIVKVKFKLNNPMITFYAAKHHGIEANFISHITATVDNEIVLDMSISSYLPRDPFIKYKFKDINQASSIKYTLTDNKDRKKEHSFAIQRKEKISLEQKKIKHSNSSVIDFRKTNPLAWKATNLNEAIKELYGSVEKPIKGEINLTVERTECYFPVEISSKANLESLALFIDTGKLALPLAVFSISPFSIIDYKILLKRPVEDYTLVVIGKDRDGKFYKVTKKGHLHSTGDACL